MRIQGKWDCSEQDQESKPSTSIWEPMEPIDEEPIDLVDLEDVTDSKHMHGSAEQTIDATEDHLEQSNHPKEPVPWLAYRLISMAKCIIWLVAIVKLSFELNENVKFEFI